MKSIQGYHFIKPEDLSVDPKQLPKDLAGVKRPPES